MNTFADKMMENVMGTKLIINCVPNIYISAGTPNMVLVDMNEAASDMTTGNIGRFLFPVKNSLLSVDLRPRQPKTAPIMAEHNKKKANTV